MNEEEIKIRSLEQQAIDNLKLISCNSDEEVYIEPSLEDTARILLDYITNLQEELKYQKEAEWEYNEKHTKLMKKYKELQERKDKAIEYLEQKPVVMVNGEPREIYVEDDNKLLKILKGEDNNGNNR